MFLNIYQLLQKAMLGASESYGLAKAKPCKNLAILMDSDRWIFHGMFIIQKVNRRIGAFFTFTFQQTTSFFLVIILGFTNNSKANSEMRSF